MMSTQKGMTPDTIGIGIEDAIFDTAINIEDAALRHDFLQRTFRDDLEGMAKMEELLKVAGESAAFFIETRKHQEVLADEIIREMPGEEALFLPPVEEDVGTLIGRYRLVSRIGSGGYGVVYEAEQQEPVRRKVALKVIRLGMDTEKVISRFEVERQALALMDHPNISRVLDAGTTGGRPYFVMELVEGERITSYCDSERLDITARLQLFIQVCHAIQHAHQKGIIHRDIKPSNILIATHDAKPMPKVIDFGIAKATRTSATGRHALTASDQFLGTPAYMSPEQIDMAGIDVDTRGDVYSLGALLYELLVGRPPFDGEELAKLGMSEMRRTLMQKEPPRLSVVLSADSEENKRAASLRRCDRGRLVGVLKGDLDWIVMKAMEKDRNCRYQTVNSLAMDVKRFLENQPVSARRPRRIYLLRKFIGRNRVACISGVTIAMSLVAGLGVATILYLRERTALAEQERLASVAEVARSEEARLRNQAQARENVSRAAVLLSEGLIAEADALLRESPLETITPSREAADVFRSLGGWNAIYGRWSQATTCFALLIQANQLGDPGKILEGVDLLMAGPAFLENGDEESYESFRLSLLDRYPTVGNMIQAEHLLKVCLLTPADDKILKQLEGVAKICAGGVSATGKQRTFREWEALALAIYHYRKGDFRASLDWSRKCLEFPDRAGSRESAVRCIMGMALFQLGTPKAAAAELEKARGMLPPPVDPDQETRRQVPGNWYAWSVSRLLLKEGDALMGR